MTDISTTSWSETDSGNNQQPPEGWPAGMNANGVEPSARMNMGAVKRFWNRVNPVYTAALATTDSYTVSPSLAVTGYGLYETWRVRFPSASTATSPNILISSLPAQPIRKYSNGSVVNLVAGDIQGQDHSLYWDGTEFILSNPNIATGAVTSLADASNGGLNFSAAVGALTAKLQPSDLLTKGSPTVSDSIVLMDNAASNAAKTATVTALGNIIAALTAGASGNITFSNGLIIQWFTHVATNSVTTTVSFPTPFPNNCWGCWCVPNASIDHQLGTNTLSATQVGIGNASLSNVTAYCIAVGN